MTGPINWEEVSVTINRGGRKLGLNLEGGSGDPQIPHTQVSPPTTPPDCLYITPSLGPQIRGLVPGGLAEKDGGLKVGDRLVSINGKCTEGLSKHEAVRLIDRAGDQLVLVVSRERRGLHQGGPSEVQNSQEPSPLKLPSTPQQSTPQEYVTQSPAFPHKLTPPLTSQRHTLTDSLHDAPTVMPLPPPSLPPPSVASLVSPQEVSRPGSLGPVPKGSRQDNCPFEIEVSKTALGLGLTLGADETGMVMVKSLKPNSPITKDGNIRYVYVCVCVREREHLVCMK